MPPVAAAATANRHPPLPVPEAGPDDARRWVVEHLTGLFAEDPAEAMPSPRYRGGQAAADAALAAFGVAGYASRRNEAYPVPRRGASGLSPYIRHGLLTLPEVWAAVAGGPAKDVKKFRDELLWQEYARHWYARLGRATGAPVRHRLDDLPGPPGEPLAGSLSGETDLACLELTVGELEEDGWLVNQTRMWLASHWTIRLGRPWTEGEDWFFRHLLDGSRAANRLGWQWVTAHGSSRPYGFSRWQVERRAPGLCASCELGHACPIDTWPDDPTLVSIVTDPRLARDDDPRATAGPAEVERSPGGAVAGTGGPDRPEAVWLTAESLASSDPALAANPDLPAVFVFDRTLLARLQLSAKRLVFLVETLSELAGERPVELHLGDPVEVLAGRTLAATFAPVPGWRRRAAHLDVVETHPWPWLRRPGAGPVGSFSAWRKGLRTPERPE
ncbi:MAG: FAD-binding domain-containing protein [Actinomycetota bacterium]